MPETIYATELAAMESLTHHLSGKGIGPKATAQLTDAMRDTLAVAIQLVQDHPSDVVGSLRRISGYLGTVNDHAKALMAAAIVKSDDGVIDVDPVAENPTTCGLAEGCCLPFGHDGDHDFGEEE